MSDAPARSDSRRRRGTAGRGDGGSGRAGESSSERQGFVGRVGMLLRRASWGQRLAVGMLALVAAHGIYVLFVPGVDIGSEEWSCPPAVVAAVAGSQGVETASDPAVAAEHDAACASTGRWWVVAAGAQTAVAGVWALAILEWGRVRRRTRRARRRERRARRRREREQAAHIADAAG